MLPLVLAGTSHHQLAEAVAKELGTELGEMRLNRFPDAEVDLQVRVRVRGERVFIVQSLSPPPGEALLELALVVDACRRQGAREVTAVIPYFGYARQDRRDIPTQPLGVNVVARLLGASAVDRVIALDVHSGSLEGSLDVPLERAHATPLLIERLRPLVDANTVIVSPDLGAVKRVQAFALQLGAQVAFVHKERVSGTEVKAHAVVGDVEGRRVVLVDDIISTGQTIAAAVRAVIEAGALPSVTCVAVHGLFCGNAPETLSNVSLERIIVTDSLPARWASTKPAIDRVSCAPALAIAIRGVLEGPQRTAG